MTNDKEPMTKGTAGISFVNGSWSLVIPWSLVGHWSLVINQIRHSDPFATTSNIPLTVGSSSGMMVASDYPMAEGYPCLAICLQQSP
jgi:hypothetical protein